MSTTIDELNDRLLPEHKNPVEIGIQTTSELALVFEAFDATSSSKRHYDHVAPLDGITAISTSAS